MDKWLKQFVLFCGICTLISGTYFLIADKQVQPVTFFISTLAIFLDTIRFVIEKE